MEQHGVCSELDGLCCQKRKVGSERPRNDAGCTPKWVPGKGAGEPLRFY